MKLDSYILRYGELRDLTDAGLSPDIISIITVLPPLLRSKVRSARAYYIDVTIGDLIEKEIASVELSLETGAFVHSHPGRSPVVPYYLKGVGELGLFKWQAKFYLKTGFWLEPSSTGVLRFGSRDSIKTRAKMASLVMIAPVVFPGLLLLQHIGIKYKIVSSWISNVSK